MKKFQKGGSILKGLKRFIKNYKTKWKKGTSGQYHPRDKFTGRQIPKTGLEHDFFWETMGTAYGIPATYIASDLRKHEKKKKKKDKKIKDKKQFGGGVGPNGIL